MAISYITLRKDNRAGVDKLLDWLRIHLVVLLCGGFVLGVSLEETGLAVKKIVSAKHQKIHQEQPPNGFVTSLPASSGEQGYKRVERIANIENSAIETNAIETNAIETNAIGNSESDTIANSENGNSERIENRGRIEATPAVAFQDAPSVVPAESQHYQMAVYYPNGIRLKTFVSR